MADREILQVDRRKTVHRGAVQLHLGAGSQAREAQLSRRAVHAEQTQSLFVRERTGRLLRTHPQIERRLLWCRELDLQRPDLRVEPPRVHELRRRIRHGDTVRHSNSEVAQLTLGQAYLKVVHSRHDPGCRDEELLELRVEYRLLDALVARLGFPVDPHIRLGRQHQIDFIDPVFRKCVFQRHGIRRGHFQFLPAHFQREEVYHRRLCWHSEAPHAVAVFHARLVLETDVVHTRLVCNKLLRCRLADRELRQLQFAVLEIDALQHRWRGEKLDAAAGLGLPLERAGKRHAAAGHLAALHHGEQPPAVRLGRLAKRRAGAQKQAKQDRRRSGAAGAEPSIGLDGAGGFGGLGGSLRWAVTLGQATCTSTNRMASPAKQCRPLGTISVVQAMNSQPTSKPPRRTTSSSDWKRYTHIPMPTTAGRKMVTEYSAAVASRLLTVIDNSFLASSTDEVNTSPGSTCSDCPAA